MDNVTWFCFSQSIDTHRSFLRNPCFKRILGGNSWVIFMSFTTKKLFLSCYYYTFGFFFIHGLFFDKLYLYLNAIGTLTELYIYPLFLRLYSSLGVWIHISIFPLALSNILGLYGFTSYKIYKLESDIWPLPNSQMYFLGKRYNMKSLYYKYFSYL